MHTSLIALELAGVMNQVNIDRLSTVKEFALEENVEPSIQELTRIFRKKNFKASIKKLEIEKLVDNYPMPIITMTQDGEYVTIIKVNKKKKELLIYDPYQKKSIPVSYQTFKENFQQNSIVLKHRFLSTSARFGFGWFFEQILNYKKIMVEVLLAAFFIQIFALMTPIFMQVILDKVLVHHSISTLNVIALAFLAVIIFDFVLNLVRNYIFSHTTAKIDAKLGSKLFDHLLSLPFSYFNSRQVGNTIVRVRELDNIRTFISEKSITVLLDVLFSFVFVTVMFIYSVKLTLIALGFVSIIAIFYFFATPSFRRKLEDKFQMAAKQNAFLVESITGIETVKSLALEGKIKRDWEDRLAGFIKSNFHLSILGFTLSSFSSMIQKLMGLVILYYGVLLVIDGGMTVGQLIAFRMFSSQFTSPIIRLANLWNEFQQALLSVDRLGDILNMPPEHKSDKSITLAKIEGDIKFKDVNFAYSPGAPTIIKDFTLHIKPNTSIGIVGRSGSGKSTITKLVQRLYGPNDGSILIDDVDVRNFDPQWYRSNIGVVLQESYLFSGSIKDNIASARPDATMEMVVEIAKVAGANEFISELPNGYDTSVGERGTALSGGQKQRLAIARALITNPKILIFDEATSALDYESERIIRDNLEKIKKNRTTIIIAHRLSTVRNCDIIIAMDKGKIIERGTHEQLLRKKGYYYKLNQQQEL